MKINAYRYFVSLGRLCKYAVEVSEETSKYYMLKDPSYIGTQKRVKIAKSENDNPIMKDRTCYPYIDFYSTENPSREYAVKRILEFFENEMR